MCNASDGVVVQQFWRITIRARIRRLAIASVALASSVLLPCLSLMADDASIRKVLPASDWSNIRALYESHRHAAVAVEGGYLARNPGQNWRTRFDGRGFETTPDAGDWSWGLELIDYGREGVERTVTTPFCIDVNAGRVMYDWDATLTEWYINDTRGLEHGYTLHGQPRGRHSNEDWNPTARADLLQFTLAVRGELRPQVSCDGRGVVFLNSNGAAVVHYTGLTVNDATGKSLPAWFEEASDQRSTFDNSSSPSLNEISHLPMLRIVINDEDSVYPLTIDPIAQQAYLKASNTGSGDQFGFSVAVSGDTVVVGAHREDSSATGVNGNQADNSAADSGAAYVFVRSGATWSQQAYLKASNTGTSDNFGYSVSISGDTVLVGAYREDSTATGVDGNQFDNSAEDAGAAYVFVRSGSNWNQQAYLKASNTSVGDGFGYSVAVSGDTVVVGAIDEDSSATGVNGNQSDNAASGSGAAYVFERSGTVWSQQAYLKASNTGTGDIFGISVAVSGDTVVIGANGEDSSATGVNGNQSDNSSLTSGAAYVFVRSGVVWTQQSYFKASNTDAFDEFGISVSVSGDTAIVGAYLEDSNSTGVNGNQSNNSAADSGAVYVFVRSSMDWSQQAYLKASNTGLFDRFGYAVSISGDTAVVGARFEDSGATGVDGIQADESAMDSGAVYVFDRGGATWSQQAYLKASNTGAADNFGATVAVSGNTVVVGAQFEDSNSTGVNGNQADNAADGSGAAYVFVIAICPTLGDMNCDCAVNIGDLPDFVQALVDPANYTGCNILYGDMQPDGNVDGADVQGFVDLLTP